MRLPGGLSLRFETQNFHRRTSDRRVALCLTLLAALVIYRQQIDLFVGETRTLDIPAGQKHLHERTAVTFIIPTKGRDTLERALDSLQSQTDEYWRAIVVVATRLRLRSPLLLPPHVGIASRHRQDARIIFLSHDRVLSGNCAGSARNFALPFSLTDWIAFLDDDDTVSRFHVQSIHDAARQNQQLDLLSFRMFDHRNKDGEKIVPRPEFEDAVINHIGISFAFKRTHTDFDYFVDSPNEDYLFIKRFCFRTGRVCFLSEKVSYYVKGVPPQEIDCTALEGIKPFRFLAVPLETFSLDYLSLINQCRTSNREGNVPNLAEKASYQTSCPDKFPGFLQAFRENLQRAARDDSFTKMNVALENYRFILVCPQGSAERRTDIVGNTTVAVIHTAQTNTVYRQFERSSTIWVSSESIRQAVLSAGILSEKVSIISPWTFLEKTNTCRRQKARKKKEPSFVLVSPECRDTNSLRSISASVKSVGGLVECIEIIDLLSRHSPVCDAEVAIFLDFDHVPWIQVEELVVIGKRLVILTAEDSSEVEFHRAFAVITSSAKAVSQYVRVFHMEHATSRDRLQSEVNLIATGFAEATEAAKIESVKAALFRLLGI
mmetsp:Transcript_10789/g.39078  ORF Transcript_10789/g.39078 Transcript_10789/m.39078 type:complete len:604 (+) Transcript_10789:234-2045(+)